MRVIFKTNGGSADHLKLQEVDRPVPGDDEVPVRVNVATVTMGGREPPKAQPLPQAHYADPRVPQHEDSRGGDGQPKAMDDWVQW